MPHSHPHSPRSVWRTLQRANPPRLSSPRPARGFTLVELMVVIGIIGMLTAISVPIVMQALAKARNAAIKAEIDMLHMAIMNYKNQYGSFPPCFDSDPDRPLDPVTGNIAASAFAQRHLKRLFPRCITVSGTGGQFRGASAITPANSMRGWLMGFTPDISSPLQPPENRKSLYGFDMSRLDDNRAIYFPSKQPQSPYIYISSNEYGSPWPAANYTYSVGGNAFTISANTYSAEVAPATGEFFNPDTFQILSAGRDGEWNTPDDLSNFWPSTRGDAE